MRDFALSVAKRTPTKARPQNGFRSPPGSPFGVVYFGKVIKMTMAPYRMYLELDCLDLFEESRFGS